MYRTLPTPVPAVQPTGGDDHPRPTGGTRRARVSSDAESFSTDDPDSLFKYGQEAGEESRMLLANVWTLATLHGWSITASGPAERLSIRLDELSFA